MDGKFSLGILGMGVMGRSLALNFTRNGYPPVGYDVSPHLPEGFPVQMTTSLQEMAAALTSPRIFFLMVPAGAPVDTAIAAVVPFMQKGDLIIDGGNSFFEDTERRLKALEAEGFYFIGMGVSGGESGALYGPSLMPGGSAAAWPRVQPMLEAIAAKAEDGTPCVAWMGGGGAGHYVKMVHNGIEYGDLQLIAEIYDLLHRGAGISNADLAMVFADWNTRELRSYLVEITAKILAWVDQETGKSLVDLILDEAEQKGTGLWTSENALSLGVPIPTINAAVESRLVSALKDERVAASKVLGSASLYTGDAQALVRASEQALYASKITSYAQGLNLLKNTATEYNWGLDITRVVPVWRAGCIIRADLLEDITAAYRRTPELSNLLMDDHFAQAVVSRQAAWRQTLQAGVGVGIPMEGTSAALAYFDAYRSAVLPANLTQAQRDYFGAHTYRRIDRAGVFHTDWEGLHSK